MTQPNKSPEPLTTVGAGRWLSQRCHDMDAPNMKIAARTVMAVPPSLRYGATSTVLVAGRRGLSFRR